MTSLALRSLQRRVAVDAVRLAAAACTSVQHTMTSASATSKSDASPVTVADLASQAIVVDRVWRHFPGATVVAEEDASQVSVDAELRSLVARLAQQADEARLVELLNHGQRDGRLAGGEYWVLDPVDGTKGFLRREQFAVCLALMDATHRPVLSVLASPNWTPGGLLLVAERGAGTESLPLVASSSSSSSSSVRGVPVRVRPHSGDGDLSELVVTQSLDSSTLNGDEIGAVLAELGVRRATLPLDSATKYAAVATGAASIYLRMPNRADYFEKVWDHAAGVLVVEEAGGVVSDVNGAPLDFAHGRTLARNRGIVATSGAALHARTLAAIAASCKAPTPPTPPRDFECCGNGCEPCVFEIYDNSLALYRDEWAAYKKRMELRGLAVAAAPAAAVVDEAPASRLSAFEEFERQLQANREQR